MLATVTKQLLLGTAAGRRAVMAAVAADPSLGVEPLGQLLNRSERFGAIQDWPADLSGFDDLAFLFSSNPLNWGIASLTLEEATFIYRLVSRLDPGTIAEIGRFKGGSTFLIAAAMHPRSQLRSYDLHVKLTSEFRGDELDAELTEALRRYGLADRVELIVGDSRTVEPPPECRLVFIDGDHSYEGARADFDNWRRAVAPGGHLLFHDAKPPGGIGVHHTEVEQVVAEVAGVAPEFARAGGAGTIAHFVRRG
jgi:predicted O-methyltransferase YrrM